MKTKAFNHGTAFEVTYKLSLRGEVEGTPVGWAGANIEAAQVRKMVQESLVRAVADFYQVNLRGVTLNVEVL